MLQQLEQQGELAEHHCDPISHELARRRYGVTQASIAAVAAQGRIPLILTDVQGAEAAKAKGLDCLTVFLAPNSPQVHSEQHAVPMGIH